MLNNEENRVAKVEDQSERVSRKDLKVAKRQHQTNPKTRGHPNPHRGQSLPKFEDVLDTYVKGRSVEELSQQFNLKPETVKAKLASLELAKLKLQTDLKGQGEQVSGDSTPKSEVQTPKGGMQPASSGQDGTTASGGVSGDGAEGTEELVKIPNRIRRDGRETVNTIEMAIRGVNTRETFSPITILLLSYLKYLGGEQMKDASFGFMVDWAVRKLCRDKGIDIQIGRSVLPDDII
jgi:hypothetical protein